MNKKIDPKFSGILDEEELKDILAEEGLEAILRKKLGEDSSISKDKVVRVEEYHDVKADIKFLKCEVDKVKTELVEQQKLLQKIVQVLEVK